MRLKMALVGGGPGSLIGPVHRIAAELDREIELVAGAFSSNAARSAEAGAGYKIDPARAYPDLDTLLREEKQRDDGADFIAIATPNHLHLPAALAALNAGFAVMSDKPATANYAEALELRSAVRKSGLPYALTYTYTGYPLVREAKARIAAGVIGDVRKVVVEYPQGWLSGAAEGKQAEWRTDPARSGLGGCISDIGVHAFHLAEFVTGLRVTSLMADLGIVVPGRQLDDDVSVLLRFNNGARGVLMASQISFGEANGIKIRVYGENGAFLWQQEEPNNMRFYAADGTTQIIRAGDASLGEWAQAATRTPGGHPEGYLESFANLYKDFAGLLRGTPSPLISGIDEGVRSMAFIETAIDASAKQAGWTDLVIAD